MRSPSSFPSYRRASDGDRLRHLDETRAAFVTATDSSCLLHLDGIRRRTGSGPRPLHLAEILASEAPA